MCRVYFTPDTGVMENTFLLHRPLHLSFHSLELLIESSSLFLTRQIFILTFSACPTGRCVRLRLQSSMQKEKGYVSEPCALRECCCASDRVHSMFHVCQWFSRAGLFVRFQLISWYWGFGKRSDKVFSLFLLSIWLSSDELYLSYTQLYRV